MPANYEAAFLEDPETLLAPLVSLEFRVFCCFSDSPVRLSMHDSRLPYYPWSFGLVRGLELLAV